MKYVLTFCIFFNSFAFAADCRDAVQLIEEGQKAQCTGFLFSPDAEKQASQDSDDLKYYKEINLKLLERKELVEQDYTIMENRMLMYQDQSIIFAERLTKIENNDKWNNVIWFGLGILATSLAVFGASQLDKK